MDVKTPKEFFEKVLPGKVDASKLAGLDAIVQMSISGDNGGEWHLIMKNQKLDIRQGVHPNPQLTVKVKDTDFVAIVNGKLPGPQAYMTGKLKLKGDIGLGMKLKTLGMM